MLKITSSMLAFCFAFGIQSAVAAEYDIDPAHSSVGFKIKHLAISNVTGNFSEFHGTINFDPAKIEQSSTKATVSVKSIDTQQAKRDDHLRSPDFFDAPKYSAMSFVSKKIEKVGEDQFKIHGDLTIRDVTKPVVLDASYGGAAIGMQGEHRIAFDASTVINRRDFGLTWNKVLEAGTIVVGDDVKVEIHVEGVKKG